MTLPDGKECPGVPGQTSPMDIAKTFISKAFAKRCIVAKVIYLLKIRFSFFQSKSFVYIFFFFEVFDEENPEGKLWDLTRPLERSCNLELKQFDDDEG